MNTRLSTLRGIAQLRNVLTIPLEDVYVPLNLVEQAPERDTLDALTEEWTRGAAPEEREQYARRSIADLLKDYNRLAILGDPGAGKSTLLKHTALLLTQADRAKELGLPESVLPILFPLAEFSRELQQDSGLTVAEFLPWYFKSRSLPRDLAPLLADALDRGSALVLADGLDEVFEPGQRHTVVSRFEDFVRANSGNRYLVASRIAGYADAPLDDSFSIVTVTPFDDDDIERFAKRWCRAYERLDKAAQPDRADARAREHAGKLVNAIQNNDRILRLARNPLLLTILAIIQYQSVRLPEDRAELYRLCVEALAETWNRSRNIGGRSIELNLGDYRLDDQFVVHLLGPIALEIHRTEPGGLVDGRDLRKLLQEQFERDGEKPGDARQFAIDFIDLVRRGSGLLQERGADLYGFMHLTFEEYLAARYLSDEHEDPISFFRKNFADTAWREIIAVGRGSRHTS